MVAAEPTGQYARRAAFLYEWLIGNALDLPAKVGGNYVDVIDDASLVAASPGRVMKIQRWRVNDNLPGTRHFCPIVVKTDAVTGAANVNVSELFGKLTAEFGEDLLLRAAAWMTLRESRASFAIEGEADQANRIERFADVMARRTGQGVPPLTSAMLAELQREILGRTTLTQFRIRQSPAFVGELIRQQERDRALRSAAGRGCAGDARGTARLPRSDAGAIDSHAQRRSGIRFRLHSSVS